MSVRRQAVSLIACSSTGRRAWPRSTSATGSSIRGSATTHAFRADLLVCDVSFISVRTALPPVVRLLEPGWEALVLVKPQFEAGRDDVGRGGVVRDPEVRRRVLREVAQAATGWGGVPVGVVDSGHPGPKGNREFLLQLVHREDAALPDDLDDRIDAALA